MTKPSNMGQFKPSHLIKARETPFRVLGQGSPKDSPDSIGYCCYLNCLPEIEHSPYCWRHHVFQIWDWEDSSFIWSETLFPVNWHVALYKLPAERSNQQSWQLWFTTTNSMHKLSLECNSGIHLLVVINSCPIGLKVPYLPLPDQNWP